VFEPSLDNDTVNDNTSNDNMLFKKTSALLSQVGHRVLKAYDEALIEKPLLTKSVSALVIAGAADLFCQTALQHRSIMCKDSSIYSAFGLGSSNFETIDYTRAAVMASYAALIILPVHFWLIFLSQFKSPSIRMLIDQLAFAPVGTALCIAYTSTLLSDRSMLSGDKFVKTWLDVLMANWAIWPLLQWVNFSRVPLRYQPLFSNLCGFAWTIFLSSRMFPSGGVGGGAGAGGDILERISSSIPSPSSFFVPLTLIPSTWGAAATGAHHNEVYWPHMPQQLFGLKFFGGK